MATAAQRAQKRDLGPDWRESLAASVGRFARRTVGIGLIGLSIALFVALLTHSSVDPSFTTAAGGPPTNWLGAFGSYASDAMLFLFGPASALFLPLVALAGLRLVRGVDTGRIGRAILVAALGVMLIGIALGLYAGSAVSGLPAGYGGALGLAGAYGVDSAVGAIGNPAIEGPLRLSLMVLLVLAGFVVGWFALGVRDEEKEWATERLRREPSGVVKPPRRSQASRLVEDEDGVAAPPRSRPAVAVTEPAKAIAPAKAAPKKGKAPGQASLALGDNYQLPPIALLAAAPEKGKNVIDRAGLERNARLLESVLEDFHVRGDIVEVRPGPVVTMYELEPASGIKASRVIQLADDIARNMSALSARVATIPGRSVIGIELPNTKRESVALSELIGSQAFEDQNMSLPLILGKNISGDPVIVDLAPMPHLLVAGTTGSGKSVGLNCMILSLLYRMGPDECRMIMIDPKMLELSIYDAIPHLLAPVVTEPGKAIRALKWTVEQMEERYRMMASLGVRQLASFNQKVRDSKAKGAQLGRKVQTGYNADTGQPVYETEELEYEVLPQIVVVVDELADLMMTAGKEVEFLIQRLAQKARAAGIHLIMATQRPSVDVITGVIKANLPTRISFQVTSKIDSRTILGEQGAEQLLGKGDMLYMPGGKQILRVHGPFVSDDEVRAVADHWRKQGVPDYIQAVTEEPEDGGYQLDGAPVGDDDPETQLYRKAIQIVAESQKASTSYLQRQMRVGYNSAARLIERMEKDGLVGQPDHVGRREVLIDTDGHPL
ncbi:FtsK/SpoIIIE family DNA translocase [Sphingomonas sp. LY160]|uniref:FtsK/SpoIIIE family DNA translocase n=1 Tax=Sphingomonas sp. LY160 TaxID=3095342 RepID=UPI002ADED0B0|nr:DNA translocase FtsK 4TM domain-containing protein [Sphingomonas sp. LY160]MEA1072429.1 DNA translocase FtsK 4TM domain-containing protein [Sphingomonas sp. LY160]